MSGILAGKINDLMKDGSLGEEVKYLETYRTGIDIFDYVNGYRRTDGSLALGLPAGKMMMDIGQSGTGKTSVIIKQACHIVDQYEEGMVIHLDYERSTNKERILQLANWDEETFEKKYKHLSRGIYTETLYNLIKQISDVKRKNYDDLKIDTGATTLQGDPIYELPPTVIILDSIALMAPKDIEDEDELKGQMGK